MPSVAEPVRIGSASDCVPVFERARLGPLPEAPALPALGLRLEPPAVSGGLRSSAGGEVSFLADRSEIVFPGRAAGSRPANIIDWREVR